MRDIVERLILDQKISGDGMQRSVEGHRSRVTHISLLCHDEERDVLSSSGYDTVGDHRYQGEEHWIIHPKEKKSLAIKLIAPCGHRIKSLDG